MNSTLFYNTLLGPPVGDSTAMYAPFLRYKREALAADSRRLKKRPKSRWGRDPHVVLPFFPLLPRAAVPQGHRPRHRRHLAPPLLLHGREEEEERQNCLEPPPFSPISLRALFPYDLFTNKPSLSPYLNTNPSTIQKQLHIGPCPFLD